MRIKSCCGSLSWVGCRSGGVGERVREFSDLAGSCPGPGIG